MNIDTSSKISATTRTTSSTQPRNDSSATGFAEALSGISSQKKEKSNETSKVDKTSDDKVKKKQDSNMNNNPDNMDEVIDGLEGVVAEISNKLNQTDDREQEEHQKIEGIVDINNKLNQTDDREQEEHQKIEGGANIGNELNQTDDKMTKYLQNNEGIDNNCNNVNLSVELNFQDADSISGLPMNPNSGNSSENQQKRQNAAKQITPLTQGLEDENVNVLVQNDDNSTEESLKEDVSRVKTVTNSSGIKKVDTKSNITIETVASFDDIAMNKNDVDFFTKLVESGQNGISTKETAEASQVSKTLADMLAKSMNDNKPIRINFDNDISVIIKVGKDGKISADFLPSSQVAEAYLKENLPLLRQKFDDNNIDYDELNHRGQKQNEKDENQKKGRKDE